MINITEKESQIYQQILICPSTGISSKEVQKILQMDQANCNRRLNKLAKLEFVYKVKEGKDIIWFPNTQWKSSDYQVGKAKKKVTKPMYVEKTNVDNQKDTYIDDIQQKLSWTKFQEFIKKNSKKTGGKRSNTLKVCDLPVRHTDVKNWFIIFQTFLELS